MNPLTRLWRHRALIGVLTARELKAREILIYGPADPTTYPLQKKGHTMEFLREIAHLRVRSNTFGAVFRVRNALASAIHKFFQDRGFMYVHTPVISASDAEGAGSMFQVNWWTMRTFGARSSRADMRGPTATGTSSCMTWPRSRRSQFSRRGSRSAR